MKIIMRCDSHDKTQLSGLKLQATQLNVVMRQSSWSATCDRQNGLEVTMVPMKKKCIVTVL